MMTSDPQAWAADLTGLHAQVWARLLHGVANRQAPARHPTLATLSPDGWPEARTVVLRAADAVAGTLDLHTDLYSAKVAALRHCPRAALHIWDAEMQLQSRLSVQVQVLSGPEVAAIWARVPDPSRQSYGTLPRPGQPIATDLAYEKRPDADSFAVLRCTVWAIDAVYLGPEHRRASFARETLWQGQWLAP